MENKKQNKKNFFTLAVLLLMLCLITTCVVGSSLAKYTTGSSSADTARVAKWGVEVSVSGTLFGKNYGDTIVASDATEFSVASSQSADNVVAPGTKNDVGFQVTVNGTPEVDFKVVFESDADKLSDVWLAKGTYGMMVEVYGVNAATDLTQFYTLSSGVYTKVPSGTVYDEDANVKYYQLVDVVTVTDDKAYPVVWTLVNDNNTAENLKVLSSSTLAAAVEELAEALNKSHDANTNPNQSYTLTWSWAFEDTLDENSTEDDKAAAKLRDGIDTILGNLAAETGNVVYLSNDGTYLTVAESMYNLEVGLDVKLTATQVD